METVDQLVQGLFSMLLRCGISTVLLFVRKMNHIPTYLFLSRENDDDITQRHRKTRFSFGSTSAC